MRSSSVPYGTWPSPLSARTVAAGARRLGDLRIDGDDVWWIESRPDEGGRQAVLRWRGSTTDEWLPADFNARTRAHEYGGASFQVADGTVWASRWEDQRLYRTEGPGNEPVAVTPEPDTPAGVRFADAVVTPDRRWVVCVRETHGTGEATNDLVAIPADGDGDPRPLFEGTDFVAAPRLSPDGSHLAWLTWDHPQMPWDGTTLHVAHFSADGLTDRTEVAGGSSEAIFDPTWLDDGRLAYSTDRSGFWNVHLWDGRDEVALTDLRADIGQPAWQFGSASIAALDDGRLACVVEERAVARVLLVDPDSGERSELAQPLTDIRQVAAMPGAVVLMGGSEGLEHAVVRVDLSSGHVEILGHVETEGLTPDLAPQAEAVTYPTPDGAEAHAFLYRPQHPRIEGPDGELPPLLVFTHGGPTGKVSPRLSPGIAFWTSRGFAVVDVNYRGSTGYGRAYRDALKDHWGIHDVTDAIAAARFLADRGDVDPDRLAIRGGSAGGFTTLAALVDPDNPFAAGANHFGVADLAALAEHTHKFESRYLDGLVGPYPEASDIYRERSPLTHADRLTTPVIVLQGDEDEVVPPAQSEAIVAAARDAGVPHAYLLFQGEQHGFRKAENIIRALEAELAFYGRIMGFEPADDIEPIDVVGL